MACDGLTAIVAFPRTARDNPEPHVALMSTLARRLGDRPPVEAVSISTHRPLGVYPEGKFLLPNSAVMAPDDAVYLPFNAVSPGYFDSYGLRLLSGRHFTDEDAERGDAVIVSRALTERYWLERSGLGRTIRLADEDTPRRIVGIVEDVAAFDIREPPRPALYLPWTERYLGWVRVNLRTTGHGRAAFPLLRTTLRELDPTLPLTEVVSYDDMRTGASLDARVLAGLSTALAVLAAVLATIGLYGLMGFVLSRQRRELGIQSALGASPSRNAALLFRRALLLTTSGVRLGVFVSLSLGAGFGHLLFGVSPRDPVMLAGSSAGLALAAFGASWPHTRRAASVEPASCSARHENRTWSPP